MELEFEKMHGLGNDFVFIDDFSRDIELSVEQVAYLCDRRFGIGADGVILVRPSSRPECVAYMHYINADGTLAQMCGNGARCFAKYLVDHGFVGASEHSFVIETLSGPKPVTYTVDDDEHLVTACIDMGHPITDPESVPVAVGANAQTPDGAPVALDVPIASPWGDFSFTCVSMGNPHAVCFIDDFDAMPDALFPDGSNKCLDTLDLNTVGKYYESNEVFPEKSNIEFAYIDDEGIHMRVYERGCGETLACGTGACATCVSAALTGRATRENDLILRGGTLHINWNEEGHVKMTGTATIAFEGTITI